MTTTVSPAVSKSRLPNIPDLFRGAVHDLGRRPSGNVPALDVLRSVAILLVFSGHFAGEFHASARLSRLPLFYFGWTGVDLFFVLSGLLIGAQLWKEVQLTGTIRIGTFLLRRGLRIWPLYFAFIGLIVFEVVFLGYGANRLWVDPLFLSNYFKGRIAGAWSLSTEEQFYLIAPICLYFGSRVNFRRLVWLPIIGFLIPIFARILTARLSTLPYDQLKESLYSPIHTHADGLAMGMLLAWVAVFRADLAGSKRFRLLAALAMLLIGAALYFASPLIFNFTALAFVFGAATLLGMELDPSPAIVNWHGFYIISRLSYGMYLNHFGLLPHMHSVFGAWGDGGGVRFWIAYLASLLASLAIAFVTFQFIEWPFLRIRSMWMKTRRTEPVLKATPMHEELVRTS